ncbi:MAG TPA: hypothetical protein VFS59_04560 [Gemmatimonadaceae bacterium]|nr:hypothetical protein [Gemmatimonadaceae bacterium]
MDVLGRYSHIKGFCYMQSNTRNNIAFWREYDEQIVERDLDYAQRLGLNSARVFLSYVVWEREPEAFVARLRHFIRAGHERGISTMPVLWDCCDYAVEMTFFQPTYECDLDEWIGNPGTDRLGPDFYPQGERYITDVVGSLAGEPGLELWDVMNEPLGTPWARPDGWAGEVDPERAQVIWDFVHHFCGVVKKVDPVTPITVCCGPYDVPIEVPVVTEGELALVEVPPVPNLEQTADHVDVLAFHNYSPTREHMRASIRRAAEIGEQAGKPILISEMSCFARTNPYDMSIEVCNEQGIGFYFWELMIGVNRWSEIHGLVYPDGTVRDPAAVLAILGFFRKRDEGAVKPRVDRENHIWAALTLAREWLADAEADYEEGLERLERMANLLEGGELIAMFDLPTARVAALRGAGETPESRQELGALMASWGEALEPYRESSAA